MPDRASQPTIHDTPLIPIPDVQRVTLPCGISMSLFDSPAMAGDVTRITFSWLGGMHDTSSPAAAELATQLCKEGNTGMPAAEMADLLDTCGAWLGAEVQSHHSTLTLFSLNRTLDRLIGPVIDMINRPLYPSDEFTMLRERIASARETELERVTTHARELDMAQMMGHDHPLARTCTPDEIRRLTIEDVRDTGSRLHGRQMPEIFVAGRITPQIQTILESRLPGLDCDTGNTGQVKVIPAPVHTASQRVHHEMHGALQSAIRISIPTVSRSHPDYEAVRLMSTALGGYFGSRLMSAVREEQGLTYGINSGVYGYREGAFLTIQCQCDNTYVERVLESIDHEIERLATEPMSREELKAVRQTASASLLGMLDTPFGIMDYYLTQRHILTPPDYFKRQQRAIAALTPESIRDTAARYLTDRPRLISTAGVKQI